MTTFHYRYVTPKPKQKAPPRQALPPQQSQPQRAQGTITTDAAALRALLSEHGARDPSIPVFGANRRFRVLNLEWREWDTGAVHVEAIATGFEVPKEWGPTFARIKETTDAILKHHAETGDGVGRFFVHDATGRIGEGFFDSNVEAEDIPLLLTKLAMSRGCFGEVASHDPARDALDISAYGATDAPMPAFADKRFYLAIRHGFDDAAPLEHLRFAAGEKLPERFAAMWLARRAVHRRIQEECAPRNFLIYDVRDKTDTPTELYRMTGPSPCVYAKVGESHADDGKGGGYVALAHGLFDDPPSPEEMAFIDCRLAAQGRWLVLVPHEDDFVSPEVSDLMAGVARSEDVT